MATLYTLRLIVIVPVGKVDAVVNWMHNNLGQDSVPDNLGPGLNATGSPDDPVTHRWCSGAWQDGDAKAILVRLCQLASAYTPTNAQWNSWSRMQKITWLRSVRDTVLENYGAYLDLCGNAGAWNPPSDSLTAMGLRSIVAVDSGV